ncbi:MAG: hypothetical protein JXA30_11190 [Deltaproteobacteria bacterium]|nr:hypothetical protein [Deltaproteobacteria bacterium]
MDGEIFNDNAAAFVDADQRARGGVSVEIFVIDARDYRRLSIVSSQGAHQNTSWKQQGRFPGRFPRCIYLNVAKNPSV